MAELRTAIVLSPLETEIDRILARPADAESGAAVDFRGIVRGSEGGARIDGIDYECHVPMAEVQLERLAKEVARSHEIAGLVILHRIGKVPAGETSLFVRAVARHRAAAFDAAREAIERIKRDIPIWKRSYGP